jgi:hypothetical protein
MVSVLMVAGLLAIGAIGARLFLRVRGGQLQYYTRIPTTEPSKRRKEIPLPILVPPPVEPPKQRKPPVEPMPRDEPPKQRKPPVEPMPRDEPLIPMQDWVHFPGITALLSREPPEEEDDSDEYY